MDSPVLTQSPEPILPAETAYDLASPFYDGWLWQSFWRRHEFPVIRAILARLRQGRPTGLALLDVGCGTGWYIGRLEDFCREQVGVDLSDGMLAVARQRLPRATLMRTDACALPLAPGRFDAVLCTRVLSHLPRPQPAIAAMRRVIAPGGMLVLSDVDAGHDYEATRLPVAAAHVRASTHKHDREHLFAAVDNLGFVRDVAYAIHLDGRVEELRRYAAIDAASPVAGWIGAWRRVEGEHRAR